MIVPTSSDYNVMGGQSVLPDKLKDRTKMIGIDHILISDTVSLEHKTFWACYFDCDKACIDHLGLTSDFVPSFSLGSSHCHRCKPRYDRSMVEQTSNDMFFQTLISHIPYFRYDVEPTTLAHTLAAIVLDWASIAYPLQEERPYRTGLSRFVFDDS